MDTKTKSFISLKNELTKLRSQFRLNECFCCGNKAVDSHSIPKQSVLDKLKSDVGGNNHQLLSIENDIDMSFHDTKINYQHHMDSLNDKLGKHKASVFNGFCSEHEKLFLFAEQPDSLFEYNNKYLFYHSFRTYAYDFHGNIGVLKHFTQKNQLSSTLGQLCSTLPMLTESIDKLIEFANANNISSEDFKKHGISVTSIIEDISNNALIPEQLKPQLDASTKAIFENLKLEELRKLLDLKDSIPKLQQYSEILGGTQGEPIALEYFQKLKDKLLVLENNREYDKMGYFYYKLPFATSFTVANTYYIDGLEMPLSLTILPDFGSGKKKNETHIIVGCLSNSDEFNIYKSRLNILSEQSIKKYFSSVILQRANNTYFNPDYINKKDYAWKNKFFGYLKSKNHIQITDEFDFNIIE